MHDAVLVELRAIRQALVGLALPAPAQRWGDIGTAARQYGVSPVFLRRYLTHDSYPLPAKKVGGKWLVDLLAMHQWVLGVPGHETKSGRYGGPTTTGGDSRCELIDDNGKGIPRCARPRYSTSRRSTTTLSNGKRPGT